MLRFVFLAAAALFLAGCASDVDFLQPFDGAWPFSETAVPAVATAENAHCTALAHERESDAKINGFDDDMLEQVRNATYADCTAWDRDHPQPRGD